METKKEYCPLCNEGNNCCNSKEKGLGECWCTKEVFPSEIFALLPADKVRKTCICKGCLEEFIKNGID